MAVGFAIIALWRSGPIHRALATAYVLAVALSFLYFHPLHAAVPLSREALNSRMWFKGWR